MGVLSPAIGFPLIARTCVLGVVLGVLLLLQKKFGNFLIQNLLSLGLKLIFLVYFMLV